MLTFLTLVFLLNPAPIWEKEPQVSFSGDSLSVYVFLLDECVICQYYTPELKQLYEKYKDRKVGFTGFFPNTISTPERIEAFGKKYNLDFPLLEDFNKTWTRTFGIMVTPEVAVWDHRENRLLYRGRIDDSYVRVGKRKLHPKSHDLREIIELWLLHQAPPETVQRQAIGCFITFTE
jgi:peroxiredoxin